MGAPQAPERLHAVRPYYGPHTTYPARRSGPSVTSGDPQAAPTSRKVGDSGIQGPAPSQAADSRSASSARLRATNVEACGSRMPLDRSLAAKRQLSRLRTRTPHRRACRARRSPRPALPSAQRGRPHRRREASPLDGIAGGTCRETAWSQCLDSTRPFPNAWRVVERRQAPAGRLEACAGEGSTHQTLHPSDPTITTEPPDHLRNRLRCIGPNPMQPKRSFSYLRVPAGRVFQTLKVIFFPRRTRDQRE